MIDRYERRRAAPFELASRIAPLVRRVAGRAMPIMVIALAGWGAAPQRHAEAAGGDPLWLSRLNSVGYAEAGDVASDAAGNTYLVGDTEGLTIDGPTPIAYLARFASDGTRTLARQIPIGSGSRAYAVAAHPAGGAVVAGIFWGLPSKGGADIFIARHDAAGRRLWRRTLGSTEFDTPLAVSIDAAGNVLVTGYTYGNLARPLQGSADAWLAKYSPAGTRLWIRQFGTALSDLATAVGSDAAGNVMVGGHYQAPDTGYYDIVLTRFDASGARLSRRTLAQPSENDLLAGLAVRGDGSVVACGETDAALFADSAGGTDVWFATFTATGRLVSGTQIGSDANDYCRGVAVDGTGALLATGITYGEMVGPLVGFGNGWVAKVGTGGWLARVAATVGTYPVGIAATPDGDAVVGGWIDVPGGDAFAAKLAGD